MRSTATTRAAGTSRHRATALRESPRRRATNANIPRSERRSFTPVDIATGSLRVVL